MTTLAIIPARGGSKGVPGKNLYPIDGLSLLGNAILAAQQARHVDAVAVSSDDEAILQHATDMGAIAIRRPAELASDTASSEVAVLHAMDWYEAQTGVVIDRVVFIQCTSPLTHFGHIDGLVEALLSRNGDCALIVEPSHVFLWKDGPDGSVAGVNHDGLHRKRRQDLPPEYAETGAGYAFDARGFRKAGSRFFGKIVAHVAADVPRLEIDHWQDIFVAEKMTPMFRRMRQAELAAAAITQIAFSTDWEPTSEVAASLAQLKQLGVGCIAVATPAGSEHSVAWRALAASTPGLSMADIGDLGAGRVNCEQLAFLARDHSLPGLLEQSRIVAMPGACAIDLKEQADLILAARTVAGCLSELQVFLDRHRS